MRGPPPHLYRSDGRNLGRDPKTIDNALEISRRIADRGAFPVLTLNHLAVLTGASHRYLRGVVTREADPYLSITQPKRNGRGFRSISSPEPVLMDVQRWILRNALEPCAPHPASYAYRKGSSIVDCAREHVGARWLVKLDIHDFFGSVEEGDVFAIFLELGYSKLVSLELARLCTRVSSPVPGRRHSARYRDKAPYHVRDRGQLPQGAPTSGILANLVMRQVDQRLDELASARQLVYTRYSDDIILSSAGDFSHSGAMAVAHDVSRVLSRRGFKPHRKKTRVLSPGARKIVLGLLVDHEAVRLLPEFKRRIEVHIRGVRRFGLAEHAAHRKFDSVFSMINHVDGCIAYASSVEPGYAESLEIDWARALRTRSYPRPA